LHDQGNAAIGRIQRLVFLAQPLIREAAHLRDLISPDSVLHHQAARGIGAVSGEFPIPVATALRVLLRVGVPLECQFVRQLAEILGQRGQQF